MARRRVRRRKGSRRRGFSWGRLALIAGMVLALLYFAFTRFFFDPLEEGHPPFDRLVPRDVELFVHRPELSSDFLESRPRLLEAFEVSGAWRRFAASDLWQRQAWPDEVIAALEQFDEVVREAPIDLFEAFGGQEIAVVSRHLGSSESVALLARLSNAGKFAVEAPDRVGGLLDKIAPGATLEDVRDPERAQLSYKRLTLADGTQLFGRRDRDVLVIGFEEGLVRDILITILEGPTRSISLERNYSEHLPTARGTASERFSSSFVISLPDVVRGLELVPDLQDPRRDLLGDLLPRLVDWQLLGRAVGRLEMEPRHLDLALHSDVNTEAVRADKGGLAGAPAFRTPEKLIDFAEILPWDTAAVLSLGVDMRELLSTLVMILDADFKSAFDERVRRVSQLVPSSPIRSVPILIDELERAFGSRITLAVRPADHQQDPGLQPLPTLAFLMPLENPGSWEAVEDMITLGASEFGIQAGAMWKLDVGSGVLKWLEVPGLAFEELAWVALDDELVILGTDHDYVREIINVYIKSRQVRPLATEPGVTAHMSRLADLGASGSRANLAVWFDMDGIWKLVEPYAAYVADLDSVLDHGVLRAQQRKVLLQREHPQYVRDEEGIPPAIELELNEKLDAFIDEQERLRRETTIPEAARVWADRWAWRELLTQGVATLRIGDRDADLRVHLETTVGR